MRSLVLPSLCSAALASDHFLGPAPLYHEENPVVYYPASYVLPENAKAAGVAPPMMVATPDNMDPKLKALGLDFEGIWWMSDNPVHEELVSFANTVIETDGFPATLKVPNSRAGMWSWQTTAMGYSLRKYYATGDPMAYTEMKFTSSEEGDISTGLTDVPLVWVESFPFHKYTHTCDEKHGQENCDPTDCAPKGYNGTCADLIAQYPHDKWSRPTNFQDKSLFTDTTYTLKRIVYGDGSPHPVYWNEWLEHTKTQECSWSWQKDPSSWFGGRYRRICNTIPGNVQLQSYMTDDQCERLHDTLPGVPMLFGC